jgi:signal transduction histidine kinase
VRAGAVVAGLACLLSGSPAPAGAGEPRALAAGNILVGEEAPAPPADDDPRWRPVTLPDEWRDRRPEQAGFAWYRFEVEGAAAPDARLALHLPAVGMNAAAWVNGRPVGSGGSFEEPVARNFNRPLFFPFSGALLDRARNVVHVRLFCYATPHHGYLAPPLLGPAEALHPRFERQLLRQQGLAQFATGLALAMLVFVGSLWLATGRDGLYGWFVAATAFWTVNSLNYWVRDAPVAGWTWERIVNVPVEGFVVSLAIWGHRLLGLARPRLERALLAFVAAALVLAAALPEEHLYPALLWLHGLALAAGVYAVAIVYRRLGRFPLWQSSIYAAGGLVCLGFGVHDLAIQTGALPATTSQLLPFAVPVLLVPFGATLTARFVGSLRAAEALSRDLERRVAEKSAELERSFAHTRELERQQILAGERERLMREMHDGLGGQLVTALSLAEAGAAPDALAGVLRGALDEMRAVIDSLDPHLEDLGQLLGQLRARLGPVLRRNGLRLVWELDAWQALPPLAPEQSLHLLRILQEAITNALKHANAAEVRISARLDADGRSVRIAVRDDGRGPDAAGPGGRGIANMRERARRLGGALRVEAAAPGTRVELALPLTPR